MLFVDDCSPDGSLAIAQSMATHNSRLCIIRRDCNGGISRAFNSGFEAARGEYLTRLAADDVFYPTAIEIMVRELERTPEAGLVYCDMDQIDEHNQILYPMIVNPPDEALMPRNRMGLCVMWRQEVIKKIGYFDPSLDAAEDYDFWLRASLYFAVHKVDAGPQLGFRIHPDQTSIKRENQLISSTIRAQMRYCLSLAKRSPVQIRPWLKTVRSAVRLSVHHLKRII